MASRDTYEPAPPAPDTEPQAETRTPTLASFSIPAFRIIWFGTFLYYLSIFSGIVARGALARARAEVARRDEPAPAFDASVERLAIACASRAHAALADGIEPDAGIEREAADPGTGSGEPFEEGGAALASVVVPFTVDADGTRLSLISMVAQFGGIEYLDVEVPSVELMFAADERTGRWFRSELPEARPEPA